MEVEKFCINKKVFILFDEVWDTTAGVVKAPASLKDLLSCQCMRVVYDCGDTLEESVYALDSYKDGPDLIDAIAEALEDSHSKWCNVSAIVCIHPHRVLKLVDRLGALRSKKPRLLEGIPTIDMCEWFYGNSILTFQERSSFGLDTMLTWLVSPEAAQIEEREKFTTKLAKIWRYYGPNSN